MTFVSLADELRELGRIAPSRIAISCNGRDVTYGDMWERVERATKTLSRTFAVKSGDRVAYLGLNDPAQIVLLVALMRLGAILVPLNYRLAQAELQSTLDDAGAALLVADLEHAGAAAGFGIPVVGREALFADASTATVVAVPGSPERPALLVYTSGTTGKPKGAVHTQGTLYANALASHAFHHFEARDIVLTVLPLFHVGGLCIQTLPALYAGLRVILHSRFDPGAWLHCVATERATIALMIPTTMSAVQAHPQWGETDLSSLRLLAAGSSSIALRLIGRFHSRRIPVCQIYGATETGPVSIVLDPDDAYQHVGAAGKPAHGTSVMLVDAYGEPVADDGVGEILISGPNVVGSYWRDGDNSAFVDGWFRTGDLAVRDREGFYIVVGRSKDLIISGGEHIYPVEIENVLVGLDGIAEAAVVGLPDPRWGEVPVAVIVPHNDAMPDEATIRAALDAKLARFKHPRRIVFRATLPRNALGKVQKSVLIEELTQSSD